MNWIGRPMILILATGLGKGHTLQRFNYNKQYVMKEFLYRFVFANGGHRGHEFLVVISCCRKMLRSGCWSFRDLRE